MKKRIIIGDPHGRYNYIKQIYDKEQPDEVIILGDYFDSFNIDAYSQRDSYNNIIQLREEHLSKNKGEFIMLIGNHDFHYMDENFGRCSGWNPLTCSLASFPLCRDFENGILQFVYIDKNNFTIYSHAGVSQNWFDTWCKSLDDINKLNAKAFCFTYRDGGDFYGSSSYNSPLWIRPEGLKKSPYHDENNGVWDQIFGHTEPNTPIVWEQEFETYKSQFIGIDCIYKNYIVEELDDQKIITNRYIADFTPSDDN